MFKRFRPKMAGTCINISFFVKFIKCRDGREVDGARTFLATTRVTALDSFSSVNNRQCLQARASTTGHSHKLSNTSQLPGNSVRCTHVVTSGADGVSKGFGSCLDMKSEIETTWSQCI